MGVSTIWTVQAYASRPFSATALMIGDTGWVVAALGLVMFGATVYATSRSPQKTNTGTAEPWKMGWGLFVFVAIAGILSAIWDSHGGNRWGLVITAALVLFVLWRRKS